MTATTLIPENQEKTFLPIKNAASKSGIPYWKLLRACKAELIPSYKLLNSRRYVRLCDVEKALMEQSKQLPSSGGVYE